MSGDGKARYDASKLCRATGVFLLFVAFSLFGLAMGWFPVYAFLGAVFLAVPAVLLYTNTQCYRSPASAGDVTIPGMTQLGTTQLRTTPNGASQFGTPPYGTTQFDGGTLPDEERRKRRNDLTVTLVVSVLVMAVFAFVTVMLLHGSKPPAYAFVDGTLAITSNYGTRIPLADIQKIERLDAMPELLAKKNGFDMDAVRKGRFRTADGDATLFVDLDNPPFLRLTTTDDVYIVNDTTPERTQALYQALMAAIR